MSDGSFILSVARLTSPGGERSAAKRPGEGVQRFKQKARKLRAKQTSAEAVLWKALRNRQLARWKFRRQHPVDRYIVDFVTIDGKLIVEIDGATHSTMADLARDAARRDSNDEEAILRLSNTPS